jgi:maleate isomerase
MYGTRARIGYTSPPLVTEVFPYEFYKMAPEGVTLALTSLMVAVHTAESGEAEESWNHSLRAARAMAQAGVNLIILGGTPVQYAKGEAAATDTLESLQQELGVPVTNSTTAYREAYRALGAKLVGDVAYSPPPGEKENIDPAGPRPDQEGLIRVASKYAGYHFIDVGRIPSDVPLQLARELKAEHPEIDTIRLGSPHWATANLIQLLEDELGVNVVQGSQALLWYALRQCGLKDRIQGYGRLLREH